MTIYLLFVLLLHLLHHSVAAAPSETAYIATWKGTFDTDPSALKILINGVPVPDVLLHNSSHVSFLVPSEYVTDSSLLASSHIAIFIRDRKTTTIPLLVLKDALRQFSVDDFQQQILKMENERNGEGDTEFAAQDDNPDDHEFEDEDDEFDENVDYDEEEDDDEYPDGEPADIHADDESDQQPQSSKERGGKDTDNPEIEEDEKLRNERLPDEKLDEMAEQQIVTESSPEAIEKRLNEHLQQLEAHFLNANHHDPLLLHKLETHAETHARAKTALAALLLSGRGKVPRNFERAVSLLRSAADSGYPDAHALLGFLFASGIALRKHIGAAILHWTFAAEGGSTYARMALAFRFFTGTDVPEDCEKASVYYKLVADEVILESNAKANTGKGSAADNSDIRPPTPNSMFSSDRKRLSDDMTSRLMAEKQEHVQYYRHTADRGDAMAQVVMGNVYYYGAYDMPQDIPRARRLLEAAAAQGRADAHAHLGFMDLRAGRNASAIRYLTKAAKKGDKLGLHGMGYVTFHGIGVKKDAVAAARFFSKAAEKEHAEALYNLGIMYSRGIGVKKSTQEAFRLFQTAAHFRHMHSHYNLAIMMMGNNAPGRKDCSEIVPHLKLVAQQGIWNKHLSQAFRTYLKGNYADSLYKYLQAAHAGIELAQFNAAFIYEKNMLSNSDGFRLTPVSEEEKPGRSDIVEEALELYAMSASQSSLSSDSLLRMGDLAFGEARDYGRAAAAYERAVKMRNPEAMFNLGWMHARGFGMNPDRFMAKRYFDQAKDTHVDAAIPATIAVHSLKYAESLYGILDNASDLLEWCRRTIHGHPTQDDGKLLSGIMYGESIFLAFLFGVLVLVVNARQRRMVEANRNVDDGDEIANGLDNREGHDVPAAPNLDDQPHREDNRGEDIRIG